MLETSLQLLQLLQKMSKCVPQELKSAWDGHCACFLDILVANKEQCKKYFCNDFSCYGKCGRRLQESQREAISYYSQNWCLPWPLLSKTNQEDKLSPWYLYQGYSENDIKQWINQAHNCRVMKIFWDLHIGKLLGSILQKSTETRIELMLSAVIKQYDR